MEKVHAQLLVNDNPIKALTTCHLVPVQVQINDFMNKCKPQLGSNIQGREQGGSRAVTRKTGSWVQLTIQAQGRIVHPTYLGQIL